MTSAIHQEFAQIIAASTEVDARICLVGGKGMILPLDDTENDGQVQTGTDPLYGYPDQIGRGLIYTLVLLWFFLGVALASDAFMAGIEKITSSKTRVKHPTKPGRMVTINVWNDTVANLTLMAFGSSTPEILLSLIELLSKNVFTGKLGASTIVGSAAFNLFVILAICIPAMVEYKRIAEFQVYAITAFSSLFAYFWMIVVLQMSSPDIVEIWEGLVTLFMFPILVIVSYMADRGYFDKSKKVAELKISYEGITLEEIEDYAAMLKKKFGKDLGDEKVIKLLEAEMAPKKTRATYRANAIKGLTGGKKKQGKDAAKTATYGASKTVESLDPVEDSPDCPHVYWDVLGNTFLCLECVGTIEVPVKCNPTNKPVTVKYVTMNGSAKSPDEYTHKEGSITFEPSETEQIQNVYVDIIDDEEAEDEMDFYIDLVQSVDDMKHYQIIGNTLTVTIIDDDEPGMIAFDREEYTAADADTEVTLKINRRKGGNGRISCDCFTENGKALAGVDYVEMERQEVVFEHNQTEAIVKVQLQPKKNESVDRSGRNFRVVLENPTGRATLSKDTDGGEKQCIATIEFAKGDRKNMLVSAKSSLHLTWEAAKLGSGNYAGQFWEAVYCNGSKEDQAEAGIFDWFLHILSFPFKLMCALIPPPGYQNGWLCFVGALLVISILTACISDLGEMVGCCFGIPDELTAITIVALGTSLPDTFASKTSAQQDDDADAAITNVTGSNSVNVYLGLGLPWVIGSFVWNGKGKTDEWVKKTGMTKSVGMDLLNKYPDGGVFVVPGGDLGFSVTVFTICALVGLAALHYRRTVLGGELGGPWKEARWFSLLFFGLWLVYIVMSTLKLYGNI
jgi:solute carrier family 8 (sodium/calcium exchanger)